MTIRTSRSDVLTFGSLFTGIGGFDLGFERAGLGPRWQVEIDKDCLTILNRHWPAVPKLHDIREVKGPELGAVDLVCGGFPRQDLSVAGRRAGLAGERSGLFFEFMRVIAAIRPRWLVIENVPGLLSSNGGRDMGTVVGTLGELGYWWAYRVLDAEYFGVAQRRRRVFIVANLGDRTAAAKVLFEPESCDGDSPPRREAGAETARCVATRARIDGDTESFVTHALTGHMGHGGPDDNEAQTGWLVTAIQDAAMPRDKKRNGIGITEGGPMYTLDGHGAHGVAVAHALTSRHDSGEDGTGRGTPLAPTIAHENISGNLALGDSARALRSGASHSYQIVNGVRRLTPTECERLQGFPDGHTAGLSDSARYRMLGNAVCRPVAEWIGRRIIEYEKGRYPDG